ncbi:MAG TPA: hypothetical protein VF571_09155 [Pyrinomonadaceae bacterium]|jgi:hypothetical protein
MEFTQEHKNQYLDDIALKTKQGIWLTEMALMKEMRQLKEKKELLFELEQKLENKEFESVNEGKKQIQFVEDSISKIEEDINQSHRLMADGAKELEMIEEYRN